jgi:phage terminase small subunit
MKLTPKQISFADYYIELGNAEQAALKAGYSKAYARGKAYTLLANVGIKSYIDKRMEEIKSERVADQQEIMEFLTAVMRGEIDEPIPILDGEGTQKIVEVRPSAQARKAAAELLGKRYAMWTDKTNVSGNIGVTIVDDLDD